MDSNPMVVLLHAAYEELQQLEPLLERNPVYRKVSALRSLINEYQADMPASTRTDLSIRSNSAQAKSGPNSIHDLSAARIRPDRSPSPLNAAVDRCETPFGVDPAPPADIPVSAAASAPLSGRGRLGPRDRSQSARIRDAAVIFLRERGEPASGTEIYNTIRKRGVEVRGKKPSAVVCNALRWDSETFKKTSEGFALAEWLDDGDRNR